MPAQVLTGQCQVGGGAAGTLVIAQHRQAMAGRLGQADIARHHGAVHLACKVLVQLGGDLVGQAVAWIVHRAQQPRYLQFRVGTLGHAVDGFHQRGEIFGDQAGQILIALDMNVNAPEKVHVGTFDKTKSYATIRVTDTGLGMDAAQIEKVFKAYYTTKGDGGTGLGLSVVSSVVKGLGGAISISSTPGEGTTFTIYYPTGTAPKTSQPKMPLSLETADLTGKLILICDDNLGVAETHAAILESAGAETAVVEDPRDAVEALREDPDAWDALLTDFDMPHMNGAELAAAARAARADLPIVLCTAYDLHRRSSDVFDVELGKPVLPAALINALVGAAGNGHDNADDP